MELRGKISAALAGAVLVTSVGMAAWWIFARYVSKPLPNGILAASGRFEGRDARLSAAVGGRIVELHVRDGEHVRRGSVVARLDPRAAEAALHAARAQGAAAEAEVQVQSRGEAALQSQLELAELELARAKALHRQGAATRRELDTAAALVRRLRSEVEAARAASTLASRRVEAAEARVAAAEVQLDETVVEAPHAGTIEAVLVRHGEVVAPGTPIATMLELDPMRLRVYLPVSDAACVRVGARARVYPAALGGHFFEGTVQWISNESEFTPKDVHMPDERVTLVFAVDVRVPNPDGMLKDGFPADALIQCDPQAAWPGGPPW